MANENLTTWTEVDPDSVLTVSSSTLTVAAINATYSTQCYVYKDRGAAFYAGSFVHRVGPINISAASSSSSRICLLAVAMELPTDDPTFDRGLTVLWRNTATNPTLELAEFAAGNNTGDTPTTSNTYQGAAVAVGTNFYLEFERSGTTANCRLYSNSGFSTLVATLTFTISAPQSYRYVFAPAKSSAGSGATVTGTIQNIDLAPSTGGVLRPSNAIGSGGMADMNGGMQGKQAAPSRSRIVVPDNFHAFGNRRSVPSRLRF